jgi:predicted transcriptional regulator
MILKVLVEKPGMSQKEIIMQLGLQPEKIKRNLKELKDEGFLKSIGRRYSIS